MTMSEDAGRLAVIIGALVPDAQPPAPPWEGEEDSPMAMEQVTPPDSPGSAADAHPFLAEGC